MLIDCCLVIWKAMSKSCVAATAVLINSCLLSASFQDCIRIMWWWLPKVFTCCKLSLAFFSVEIFCNYLQDYLSSIFGLLPYEGLRVCSSWAHLHVAFGLAWLGVGYGKAIWQVWVSSLKLFLLISVLPLRTFSTAGFNAYCRNLLMPGMLMMPDIM